MVVIIPPALISHDAWIDEALYTFKHKYETTENNIKLKTSFERIEQERAKQKKVSTEEQNIARVFQLCNSVVGYDLSPFQKLCLRQAVQCMAQIICGNPPAHVLAEILRKYNLLMARTKMVFIGTSRRGGKTDIMTMIVAAMLIVCKNCKLLYYSIFDRTCELACETVVGWIHLMGYGHMIYSKQKQKIVLVDPSDPSDKRTVMFLNGQSVNVKIFIYLYMLLLFLLLIL